MPDRRLRHSGYGSSSKETEVLYRDLERIQLRLDRSIEKALPGQSVDLAMPCINTNRIFATSLHKGRALSAYVDKKLTNDMMSDLAAQVIPFRLDCRVATLSSQRRSFDSDYRTRKLCPIKSYRTIPLECT